MDFKIIAIIVLSVCVILSFLLKSGILKNFFNRQKGKALEKDVGTVLSFMKGYGHILYNCYVPTGENKYTETDVIWLHESGIYVFEAKNYDCMVYANNEYGLWMKSYFAGKGKKETKTFLSPIQQNAGHIKAISQFIDYPVDKIHSYVVFGNNGKIKFNIKKETDKYSIVKLNELRGSLKKSIKLNETPLSKEEIDRYYSILKPQTNQTKEVKQAHIDRINKAKAGKTEQGIITPKKPTVAKPFNPDHVETDEERKRRWEDDWK